MKKSMLHKPFALFWVVLTLYSPAGAAPESMAESVAESVAGPELNILRLELFQPLRAIAADPRLIAAVRAQNTRHMLLTAAEIMALRLQWQGEQGKRAKPLIVATMQGETAAHLRTLTFAGATETDAI